jgi:predicted RNase H-like nuclease (RuvC/YqgF family)
MIDPLDDSIRPSSVTPSSAAPVDQTVVQWLNEVKSLQQQISDLNTELIAATDNANAWRSRYDTEGQQRRAEVTAAQHTIAKLEAEIQQLRTQPQLDTNLGDSAIALQIEGMLNMNELKAKLFEVWIDRDRALEAIKSEQLAHEQTRNDLTMALADAMDVMRPN